MLGRLTCEQMNRNVDVQHTAEAMRTAEANKSSAAPVYTLIGPWTLKGFNENLTR